MQDFLKKILGMLLDGYNDVMILDEIKQFREQFRQKAGWEKGTPKRVNNLTKYRNMMQEQGKARVPGHVRAALNWNTLKRLNNDSHSMDIVDGMKLFSVNSNQIAWDLQVSHIQLINSFYRIGLRNYHLMMMQWRLP